MPNLVQKFKDYINNKLMNSKYVENERKRLELNVMQLSSQAENFKKQYLSIQVEHSKLEKEVRQFCGNLLGNIHATNQLGGSSVGNLNIYDFMKYTENSLKEEKARKTTLLANLTNKLNERERDVEGLQAQLTQYLVREKQGDVSGQNNEQTVVAETAASSAAPVEPTVIEPVKPAEEKNVVNEQPAKKKPTPAVSKIVIVDDEQNTSTVEGSNNNEENIEKNTCNSSQSLSNIITPADNKEKPAQVNQPVIAHMIDLNALINQMDDIMWAIMSAIGSQGASIKEDIKTIVQNDESLKKGGKEGFKNSAFDVAIKKIVTLNLAELEKVTTHKWYYIYTLTDTGTRIFKEKFNTDPVETEKQRLKKEHDNHIHGYLIKDTAQILKTDPKFDYVRVSIDSKENRIDLHNGEYYIPDIIAQKSDGTADYYEVDYGHHTQANFSKKCDKMRLLTKNMFFISNDENTTRHIYEKQITTWINEKGGKSRLKGTKIYVTSIKKLCEKDISTTWTYYIEY